MESFFFSLKKNWNQVCCNLLRFANVLLQKCVWRSQNWCGLIEHDNFDLFGGDWMVFARLGQFYAIFLVWKSQNDFIYAKNYCFSPVGASIVCSLCTFLQILRQPYDSPAVSGVKRMRYWHSNVDAFIFDHNRRIYNSKSTILAYWHPPIFSYLWNKANENGLKMW